MLYRWLLLFGQRKILKMMTLQDQFSETKKLIQSNNKFGQNTTFRKKSDNLVKQIVWLILRTNPDTDRTVVSIFDPPVQTIHRFYWPFQHSRHIVFVPASISPLPRHESEAGAVFRTERAFFTEFLNTDIYRELSFTTPTISAPIQLAFSFTILVKATGSGSFNLYSVL